MAVNREVQAFQDPLWGAFLGPAFLSLHLGFPEGRKRRCWWRAGIQAACAWPLWKPRGRFTLYPRQLSSGSRGCLGSRGGPAWHEWRPCIEDLTGARSHNTGAFHEQPRNRGTIERDWWLAGRRGVWWTRGISGTTLLLLLILPWPGVRALRYLLPERKTRRVILSIAYAVLTSSSSHVP